MTLLKIFKLEDKKQIEPVSTLQEGEHVLGRGGILNCTDKRVSRKHAIINITEENVTLKSVHINPCFHKASKGSIIELLKKDQSILLNDGDTFGLLVDSLWFRVSLIQVDDSARVKEENRMKESETICILAKTREDLPAPNISCVQNISKLLKTSLQKDESNINTSLLMSNLENIVEEDYGNTTKNIAQKEDISEDSDESMDLAKMISYDKKVPEEVSQIGSGSNPVKLNEHNMSDDLSHQKEEYARLECKNSVLDENNELPEEINEGNGKPEETTESTEESKKISSDDIASSSVNQPKIKREQCWYGSSCYRKNPLHRSSFSHPDDADYESDPDDNRLMCPYDIACYRTNMDHRRQYKHSGGPVAKPFGGHPSPKKEDKSDSGSSSGEDNEVVGKRRKRKTPQKTKRDESNTDSDSNETESKGGGKRKKRKAAQKANKFNETPEDDYDYGDPFLNDASSDDYEPTDDDTDDTWEDSQRVEEDSEERKRLLKEAKKFTKGKKNSN
ncbi:hypothetical protein JTB14_010995 [Gonioctena quinquepunctata]|nr:hypothetical protein JTB14_010995 [Gonioctena quinquepunctata]